MKYLSAIVITVIILIVIGFSLYVSQINSLPQSSYRLFDKLPAPKAADRILVVAPHEDDETLGAGGYISQAVKAGAAVEVIFATDGNKHGLKAERHAEALKALGVLGVPSSSVKFYDYPDGELKAQTGFQARLQTDIESFKPTNVFTTLPADTHSDHAAAGQAIIAIAKALPHQFQAYFFLIHYHRYPRPIGDESMQAYLLPPPSLVSAEYNWLVFPISPTTQHQKLTAIDQYKSQLSYKNPILRQLLLSFDQKNELVATLNQ